MQADAERTIRGWEGKLKEDELAEKRRLAPGWLDRDEKILQPSRSVHESRERTRATDQKQSANLMDYQPEESNNMMQHPVPSQEGDELDRAFGGMALRRG